MSHLITNALILMALMTFINDDFNEKHISTHDFDDDIYNISRRLIDESFNNRCLDAHGFDDDSFNEMKIGIISELGKNKRFIIKG